MPIVGSFAGASARAYGLGAGGIQIGDFYQIATTTLTGNQLQIDFDNIPQDYTHLQLRMLVRNSEATTDSQTTFRFNDDSAANYSYHYLRANGATVSSGAGTSTTKGSFGYNPGSTSGASVFGVYVIDILDYANANKYKTVRSLNGYDNNANGNLWFWSSNWRSTSAVTKISLTGDNQAGRNFVQYSSFGLYGVKA
jgi:hypothetical protein